MRRSWIAYEPTVVVFMDIRLTQADKSSAARQLPMVKTIDANLGCLRISRLATDL